MRHFKEHPSWEPVLRRLAESESGSNVKTFLTFENNGARHHAMGVGGRLTLTTTMFDNVRAEKIVREIRQSWLCRVGYHDQPLGERETTALNQIIRGTGVPDLILKLHSVFDVFPFDIEKAEELISQIEAFGVKPNQDGVLELRAGSPLDKDISVQVATHKRLRQLAIYLTTLPPVSETSKVAA